MNMILKGDICYSKSPQELETVKNGYLVCEGETVAGLFQEIPGTYRDFPVTDYSGHLIIPGLCDLHTHAPQFAYRGLGLDMQLLEWLEKYAFPEEAKYADPEYADIAYSLFADSLKRGATTRACIYATVHNQSTIMLMEKLEESGLVTFVGKVSMDRNCPPSLCEPSADEAYLAAKDWIENTKGRFENTSPILTPRFLPSCSDELMRKLKELQREYNLPVQSHLSENRDEATWVRELCPEAGSYGGAYDSFGLFGGPGTPTVMAHCVLSEGAEEDLIKDNGVCVAHCPQSNTNLSSGIAPVRRFLRRGIRVGLGSDVAGGCHMSIFRAMSDALQVSKLYWRLVEQNEAPLTIPEVFYLGTAGGGGFFGKAGSFEAGYEFDAVVIDDRLISSPDNPGGGDRNADEKHSAGKNHKTVDTHSSVPDRLSRVIFLSGDNCIIDKYVRGKRIGGSVSWEAYRR